MISQLRKQFNDSFSQKKYEAFLAELNTTVKYPADFRVSETPVFLSEEFTKVLVTAAEEILLSVTSKQYLEKSRQAIPEGFNVPNESQHPTFLQIDFGICKDESGKFIPQLIELQGFPSLYCYQALMERVARKHFPIPENYTTYFNGLNERTYISLLKEIIIGDSAPENVVLLEIEPEKQKTRIDFACTESMLGVKSVCVTKIVKRGKKLFYKENGKEIPIERIYNRVIFDELTKKNLHLDFHFTDELDVTWAGHPNWFFKISKYSLSFIESNYAPKTYFLNELKEYPSDLNNYVLKPLFSFAGTGVSVEVTKDMLESITEKQNYILQRKVEYAPCIQTPDEFAKVEIRMMFIWKEKPLLVNNLVRMSKGKMMGVDYNKNKTWVGSSLAFHP
ncbi:MAG: hypothetical protein KGZ58_07600 [Ignavibacteriales bacterium]|nr:hypothetical protein [Ignavibacteriales bacterium]